MKNQIISQFNGEFITIYFEDTSVFLQGDDAVYFCNNFNEQVPSFEEFKKSLLFEEYKNISR